MSGDLTKWPRLLVRGEPVTLAQANEILIRTTPWNHLIINDHQWESEVLAAANELLDHPIESRRPWRAALGSAEHDVWIRASQDCWKKSREWATRCGILDLCHLHNEQIMSSWIGGPHGWCDWDGTIGCATFNVGKWLHEEDVTADWQAIAAAWPFLDLTAQLVADEGDGEVVAEWRVHGGIAELVEPAVLVVEPRELDEGTMLAPLFLDGERGVDMPRLRAALTQVRDSLARQGGSDD